PVRAGPRPSRLPEGDPRSRLAVERDEQQAAARLGQGDADMIPKGILREDDVHLPVALVEGPDTDSDPEEDLRSAHMQPIGPFGGLEHLDRAPGAAVRGPDAPVGGEQDPAPVEDEPLGVGALLATLQVAEQHRALGGAVAAPGLAAV